MSGRVSMAITGRVRESAAATRTFGALRVERRVLSTSDRTIPVANIASISVGTHTASRPRGFYWLAVFVFAVMALGSMRPDFSWGPLMPTAFTALLGLLMLVFLGLALRPDDKRNYLIISSNDGVISRFTADDHGFLDEVLAILTDKINTADDTMTLNINFQTGRIEPYAGASDARTAPLNGAGHAGQYANGSSGPADRSQGTQPAKARPQNPVAPRTAGRPAASQASFGSGSLTNGGGRGSNEPSVFVDYAQVLPSIVEMHRFYARQAGTQHLEQRLSELELLMRSGTPTGAQKSRVRELSAEMTAMLQAYPQAVDLFNHVTTLVA
jgi:hypothetical protein